MAPVEIHFEAYFSWYFLASFFSSIFFCFDIPSFSFIFRLSLFLSSLPFNVFFSALMFPLFHLLSDFLCCYISCHLISHYCIFLGLSFSSPAILVPYGGGGWLGLSKQNKQHGSLSSICATLGEGALLGSFSSKITSLRNQNETSSLEVFALFLGEGVVGEFIKQYNQLKKLSCDCAILGGCS